MDLTGGELFVLVGNAAALIWGAATLHKSVDALDRTARRLEETLVGLSEKVEKHGERLASIEGRLKVSSAL